MQATDAAMRLVLIQAIYLPLQAGCIESNYVI